MRWIAAALLLFTTWSAHATSYIEGGARPDISGDRTNPLILTLTPGFNTIGGVIGTSTPDQPLIGTGAINRPTNDAEYFTLVIPAGLQLSSIFLDGYTFDPDSNPGGSFIGYAPGDRFPLNPGSPSAIAGNDLFTTADITSQREILSLNAAPLQTGSYAFLIQETSPDSTVNYTLSFELTESTLIPEPTSLTLSLAGLLFLTKRKRHVTE